MLLVCQNLEDEMDTYELANELSGFMTEDEYTDLDKAIFKTCNMLRQQQAEIESLRNELDRAVELHTDKAIENEALHRFIDERGEAGQLIIWKAQEK